MAPKIILYTSDQCPWAHRAQIALRELGLEFETVIIDLSVPRTPEYLAINPRGLVPSLQYDGKILTESGILSQFLVDSHPSHLVKTSSESGGPLQRYEIGFFVDTYFSKVQLHVNPATIAASEERDALVAKYTDGIINHIEPLLYNAAPFFGGSSRLTLAEVLTASFIIRSFALIRHGELLPTSIFTTFQEKAPNFFKWANKVITEPSVTAVWNEETHVNRNLARVAKIRAEKAKLS